MAGFAAKLLGERAVLPGLFCLVLAGCTADGHGSAGSLEDSVQPQAAGMMALASSSQAKPASTGLPLVALPAEAGAVGSVRNRDYVDGIRQDIGLKDGAVHAIANGITVLMRTTSRKTLDESVPLYKPTESAIRAEIGAQFPHVPMQVVDRTSSNGYGPYGLALGRAAGNARCLYMWQWIDGNRLPQSAGVSGPASIRVRLCRSDMTFDAMAALVDHLVVGPEAATSAPDPVASSQEAHVIVAPVAATDAAAAPDSTTGSLRAEPDRAAAQSRRVVKRHARPKSQIARTSTVVEAGRGPRYMSPPPVPTAAALPSDLPAEAYLGPKVAR